MASAGLLDTRANRGKTPRDDSSQSQTLSLIFFRRRVQDMLKSKHHDRSRCRGLVIQRLHASREPLRYVGELLDQCVVVRHSESLDNAIDVLSNFGNLVFDYAWQFWNKDALRWGPRTAHPPYHGNDDIWYVLLRAVGLSELANDEKITLLSVCVANGTPSVREASVRALGDVATPVAKRLIREQLTDASSMVRETAQEVLADLEG